MKVAYTLILLTLACGTLHSQASWRHWLERSNHNAHGTRPQTSYSVAKHLMTMHPFEKTKI